MLRTWRCLSVFGKCAPFSNGIRFNSRICCKMLQNESFLDQVLNQTAKKYISTQVTKRQKFDTHTSTLDIETQYEAAIADLNTLQSNAATIRRSIAAYNNQETPVEEMTRYLRRSGLSLEELEKRSFIHVSGTKGKGSTCALTESILREHKIKTGFFSSPHLVSVTERIRINGQPIDKLKFLRAFQPVFKRLQETRQHETDMPSYFKFLTVLCFHIFLEEQVDVIILEVGIGGELDCTNIIRNTKTIGITSLGLEHTQLLGNTLEQIAWQKAGIIKPDSNVFTSVTQPECLEVLKKRAKEKNATLHIVPKFSEYITDVKSHDLLTNLNKVIQLNGSLAVQLAYDWLRQNRNMTIDKFAINSTKLGTEEFNGMINCVWPGRCQVLKLHNFNIHLDGAHTIESIQVCSDWFKQVTLNSANQKVLIFNTTGDRDSKKLLDILQNQHEFSMACFAPNIVTGSLNNNDLHSILYSNNEQMKRAKMHAGYWHSLCTESDEPDNSLLFSSILDCFIFLHNKYDKTQLVDVVITGSLHLIGATVLALNEFKKFKEQI